MNRQDEAAIEQAQDGDAVAVSDINEQESSWVDQISAAEGMDTADLEALADRYANVVLRMENEQERIKEQYRIRLNQIDARRKAFSERHESRVRVAVASLMEKKGGKKKSIDLASGRLGFRATQVTAEFADTSVVKTFAEEFGPASEVYTEETKIVPKVDKKALVAAVNAFAKENQGNLPNGIILAGGDDKFYISAP
jgi:Bacteriophage Mu Gam like protein